VVSAFYYARVLKALFLRPSRDDSRLKSAAPAVAAAIVAGALVAIGFGVYARPLSRESVELGRSRMFAPGAERMAKTMVGASTPR
jgi:NADH:ubiquinone oxidoreductase subunit 2 (subunit N)